MPPSASGRRPGNARARSRARSYLARWGRPIAAAVVVGIVVGLLGWSVIKQWDTLKTYPWQIRADYLILAAVFHWLALGSTFVVWHLMLRRMAQFDDVRTNAYIYYVSTLAKRIPSAIWFVGGRLALYQQVGVARSVVLNAIALETLLIGAAGVLVYLGLLPFYGFAPVAATWAVGAAGSLVLIGLLLRPQFLVEVTNRILRRLQRRETQVSLGRTDLLLWIGIYLVPWLLAGVSLHFMVQSMTVNVTADVVSMIGVSTLAMLVALLTLVLPGGLGLKELTLAALLTTWMPLPVGIVVAISYRILQTVDELLWAGAAFWLWGGRGDRKPAIG